MLAKYNRYYTPAFSDDFFNDFVGRRYYGKGYGSVPAVNIVEDNDGFRIEVAAAGLTKKDFNINIENDVLTIVEEGKVKKFIDQVEQVTFSGRPGQGTRVTIHIPLPQTGNQP